MCAPISERNGNYINRKHTKKGNEEGLRNEWKMGVGGAEYLQKEIYSKEVVT